MQIEKLRRKIDKIDRKIILQLAKRMQLVACIAKYKKFRGMAIKQQKREHEIISATCKLAGKSGLNPVLVKGIFKLIFRESYALQKNLIKSTKIFF